MVEIGHASIDEHGKAAGGQAGDQTGKEVCTRSWYKKNWHTCLRAKSPTIADSMAQACHMGCLNPNIGYDQKQRNTLRTAAKEKQWDLSAITVPCETDCSAFMSVCAEAAGVAMAPLYSGGNAPTTSNMVQKFYSTGMFDILTDPAYLTKCDYLKKGDILVCNGHTVMVLTDGPKQLAKPILHKGDKGSWGKVMQGRLTMAGFQLGGDGDFGPVTFNALVAFQGEHNLVKDGVCGPKTWNALMC